MRSSETIKDQDSALDGGLIRTYQKQLRPSHGDVKQSPFFSHLVLLSTSIGWICPLFHCDLLLAEYLYKMSVLRTSRNEYHRPFKTFSSVHGGHSDFLLDMSLVISDASALVKPTA